MTDPDPALDAKVREALGRVDGSPASPPEVIPHIRVVVWVTFFVLTAFAAVTGYTLGAIEDNTIRGALIGTWATMAVSSVAFWVGASSGGRLTKK